MFITRLIQLGLDVILAKAGIQNNSNWTPASPRRTQRNALATRWASAPPPQSDGQGVVGAMMRTVC
jgi:hypothetical protein